MLSVKTYYDSLQGRSFFVSEEKANTKVLLKSGFWYTAAFFASRAMVFLTMPLFTRLLTNGEYGDFSVFANWQATLLIICGLEVYSTVNRARFDFEKDGELDGYISSALLLSFLFTGGIFVLYLIFPHIFDRLFLLDKRYMLVMFAYLLTYPAFSMFHAKQRVEYKYKVSTYIAFSTLVLSYILAVVLTLTLKSDRLFGRIFGQYILYILVGCFFYIYYFHKSHKITLKAWKYALRIGLPLVFAYLGSQVMLSSDSIVAKHMCTAEQVSYLALVHSCSNIILMLIRAVNTAWSPWYFDMLKAERIDKIKKTFQIYLWMIIALTFAVVLLGPEVVQILGGVKYKESLSVLPVYILCGVFSVLTAQFTNLETYHKKPEYAAVFTGITAVLNVGLNIMGVKFWGYQAVSYAPLICQLILIALHYGFTAKMGVRKQISVKGLLMPVAVSLAMIPISMMLYQNKTVRYCCIAVIVVCALIISVLKRNEVMHFLRRIKSMKG